MMVDPIKANRWSHWIMLAVIAVGIFFLRILPLDFSTGRWPGPDLLPVLVFAWVIRRPDYVPTPLAAILFLSADLLFMRPPGLRSALSVLGLEFLRSRAQLSRDLPFLVEWAMVAAILGAMMLANRLVLTIFVVAQPSFGQSVMELLSTVAIYPIVVLFSALVLGVRKVAPGEVDKLGHRI